MRRKLAVAALGFGLAASLAPLSPASAVCSEAWYKLTGTCNPCDQANAVLTRYGTHLDCVR